MMQWIEFNERWRSIASLFFSFSNWKNQKCTSNSTQAKSDPQIYKCNLSVYRHNGRGSTHLILLDFKEICSTSSWNCIHLLISSILMKAGYDLAQVLYKVAKKFAKYSCFHNFILHFQKTLNLLTSSIGCVFLRKGGKTLGIILYLSHVLSNNRYCISIVCVSQPVSMFS